MEENLLKKVRKIEIKTKGLSKQLFSGEYHSAFKGKGMAFSEVREYQYGDDVRNIDWNVTARLNHPYVKVFEEERELTVMLLVDMSASNKFGTQKQFKEALITELSAILAFSAVQNNDKVGAIFFTDKIEKFIPPKKGLKHILRIISELVNFKPQATRTDISEALRYFTNIIKKRCTAFILSDFYNARFEDALKIASSKHDIAALRIADVQERNLPNMGMIHFYDPETDKILWIDTSSKEIRNDFANAYREHKNKLDKTFQRYAIDNVEILTGEDYIKPLLMLFRRREKRM